MNLRQEWLSSDLRALAGAQVQVQRIPNNERLRSRGRWKQQVEVARWSAAPYIWRHLKNVVHTLYRHVLIQGPTCERIHILRVAIGRSVLGCPVARRPLHILSHELRPRNTQLTCERVHKLVPTGANIDTGGALLYEFNNLV